MTVAFDNFFIKESCDDDDDAEKFLWKTPAKYEKVAQSESPL